MTSSYNNTPFNNSSEIDNEEDVLFSSMPDQDLLFADRDTLNNLVDAEGNPVIPSYVKGSKIWFWDKQSEQWVLQHAVVVGDETIKQGPIGPVGKSAYESYRDTTDDDPILSEANWVASLRGEDGLDGIDGQNGDDGLDGQNGQDGGGGGKGPKGDPGDAICENVEILPTSGERGKLFIDANNQIMVALG